MDFLTLAADRYSCRSFSAKPIEQDKLSAILEAGRLAPTAKNLQEQRILCVQSEQGLQLVDSLTRCRYGAPTVLVVAYDSENVFTYPGGEQNSGAEDIGIVATHMMLAAKSIGIDSLWVNLIDPAEVAKAFNLAQNEKVVLMLMLGYADENAKPSPRHTERKDISETVKFV